MYNSPTYYSNVRVRRWGDYSSEVIIQIEAIISIRQNVKAKKTLLSMHFKQIEIKDVKKHWNLPVAKGSKGTSASDSLSSNTSYSSLSMHALKLSLIRLK